MSCLVRGAWSVVLRDGCGERDLLRDMSQVDGLQECCRKAVLEIRSKATILRRRSCFGRYLLYVNANMLALVSRILMCLEDSMVCLYEVYRLSSEKHLR